MRLDYRDFLLTDVELYPNQNRHLLKKGWFPRGVSSLAPLYPCCFTRRIWL